MDSHNEITGNTPLMIASEHGHIEIVKLLLDGHLDANGNTIGHGVDIEGVDNENYTALIIASGMLLSPYTHGYSTLVKMSPYVENSYEVAKLLLDRGADINKQNDYGENALSYATSRGNYGVTELLIGRGATGNLNAVIMGNHPEILTLLLENNANVNIPDSNNMTALMLASSHIIYMGEIIKDDYKCIQIVKILLKNNADINMKDDEGMTALDYACESGNIEIARILKEEQEK